MAQIIEESKTVYRKDKFICLGNDMDAIYSHKKVERTYRWQVTETIDSGVDSDGQARTSYFGRRIAKDGSSFGNFGFIVTSFTLRHSPRYKMVEA